MDCQPDIETGHISLPFSLAPRALRQNSSLTGAINENQLTGAIDIAPAASRVEIFIGWTPSNRHNRLARHQSHSATPELLQLLTSPLTGRLPLVTKVIL
jgi:hypothetical protein